MEAQLPEDDVLLARDGAVVTISINRTERRNSVLPETSILLNDALRAVHRDRSIRVVVLRGIGEDFCAGGDIKGLRQSSDGPPPKRSDLDMRPFDSVVALQSLSQVTVAAIRGACAGAGMGYAAACDIRLASDTAVFNTAFLDAGVAGDLGLPWTLPRIVGDGRARDLCLFPRKFKADEALSIGFITRLCKDADFEATLADVSQKLAARAPLALAGVKANFMAAQESSFAAYLQLETERHMRIMDSDDRKEAFRAYIEKRKPQF